MLLYLGFGILVLAIGLLLLRAFVAANPATLASGTRTAAIVTAASIALLLLIYLILSERIGLGIAEITALSAILARGYAIWRSRQGLTGASPGRTSEIETDYLRMHLDHDSGTMSGTVRRGPFQGRDLSALSRDELVELWRQCRADDPQAAKLLEAYLDRLHADWREAGSSAGHTASGSGGAMTREEAFQILGLSPGAGEAEIREAYHRLMKKIHPDLGGSAYFAAKLNQARELLLG
jgi:hypothetical protein